jgi:hypothetical protein
MAIGVIQEGRRRRADSKSQEAKETMIQSIQMEKELILTISNHQPFQRVLTGRVLRVHRNKD